MHDIDELGNPDLCLAYPRVAYPADADIPAEAVIKIQKCFRELRFMEVTTGNWVAGVFIAHLTEVG